MATVWRSQSAFARIFAGKSGLILNNTADLGAKLNPASISTLKKHYSNYAHSPFVRKIQEQYEFEIIKNPPEWEYVQRLLPFESIPKITPKAAYPSGWIPQKEEASNLPYFIERNKNQDLSIYLDISYRGMRKISKIKKIEGDIWLMNDDVKDFLKKRYKRYIETRVHELGKFIEVKGDYVNALNEWAYSKGF
ncbi:unnamed protein product [Leptosia nina]|uniref:Large ribosomal subunit protein mL49 n=1 Tax=Leptosia nina TaxID=320188 RepID=A0AAV1J3C3_9NEOP